MTLHNAGHPGKICSKIRRELMQTPTLLMKLFNWLLSAAFCLAIQTAFAAGEIAPALWGHVDLAKISVGATTPMGALAAQIYAMHNALGDGALDFSAIIQLLRG